jgi:hypothetical protein
VATTVPLKKRPEFTLFLDAESPQGSRVVTFGNNVRKEIP